MSRNPFSPGECSVACAYHETVTQDFQRLTDQQWSAQIAASPPAEAPWIADLVSR